MNTNVIGPKVSTKRFQWIAKSHEFVADMAELQHGGVNVLGLLYNDACDTGFVLVSEVTGREAQFTMINEQRDAEGDIKFWEFHPTPNSIRRDSKLEGVIVIVFND